MCGITAVRSEAPDHCDLVVHRKVGAHKHTRTVHILSKVAPDTNVCVYNSDIDTLERAIKERVYYVKSFDGSWGPPPLPGRNVVAMRLADFRRSFLRHMPSTTPVSRRSFVEMYQGRRRVVYEKALESLLQLGVTKRDSHIKPFVKAEKGKLGSRPRVIQPRSPRYNVEVGKFIKPLEEHIYKAIERVCGTPTVMKGYNAREVGNIIATKWGMFTDPVGLGLDAVSFDQHYSRDALKWEHSCYIPCFRSPDDRAELSKLLSWQLRNKGWGHCSDGKLKYSVDGRRMSGDMNTASGNCLFMCAAVVSYCWKLKIKFQLVNNGDDCVVIVERRDMARFKAGVSNWFLDLGFTLQVEDPVFELERLEFCQAHPVFDGQSYVMVRNLRAFTKDSCCLIPLNSDYTRKSWFGAVGDAGMSLTGGLPIWQEFYALYQRTAGAMSSVRRRRGAQHILDQAAFETGMMFAAKGMQRRYGDVSAQARYSFWLAFGITPDHQVAVERLYASTPVIAVDEANDYCPLPLSGFTTAYGFGTP